MVLNAMKNCRKVYCWLNINRTAVLDLFRFSSEQVWTCLQWWPPDVTSREGADWGREESLHSTVPCIGGGVVPCTAGFHIKGTGQRESHVTITHNALDLTTQGLSPCGLTDMYENIIFTAPLAGGNNVSCSIKLVYKDIGKTLVLIAYSLALPHSLQAKKNNKQTEILWGHPFNILLQNRNIVIVRCLLVKRTK